MLLHSKNRAIGGIVACIDAIKIVILSGKQAQVGTKRAGGKLNRIMAVGSGVVRTIRRRGSRQYLVLNHYQYVIPEKGAWQLACLAMASLVAHHRQA